MESVLAGQSSANTKIQIIRCRQSDGSKIVGEEATPGQHPGSLLRFRDGAWVGWDDAKRGDEGMGVGGGGGGVDYLCDNGEFCGFGNLQVWRCYL